MGLADPKPSKSNSCCPYQQNKKRDKNHKYPTIPVDKNFEKNQSILVSIVSQTEYMKNHLLIKSGVEKDRGGFRYQSKKVSLRNYTPKTINQEINMGMWI